MMYSFFQLITYDFVVKDHENEDIKFLPPSLVSCLVTTLIDEEYYKRININKFSAPNKGLKRPIVA